MKFALRYCWPTAMLVIALASATGTAARAEGPADHTSAPGGHAAQAETGDHADHAAGHEINLSPMTIDPDLAIYTLVVFIILFIVLAKFAWKPIAAGLDAREQGIADNIAAAQRTNDEAKALLAQYEKRLASAQDEVRAILDEARRDAEHTQQEILAKAQAEAELTRQRALRDIESASAAAMKELAEHASHLAVQLAGKIVKAELKTDGHARLIQDALAKFPTANRN